MYRIAQTDALLIVDPQIDFLPGGSLAVAEGHRIFDPINRISPKFSYVVATRDWHPNDHAFFQSKGGPWPYHCLAGTFGAQFSTLLDTGEVDDVVSKGIDPNTDGYSGFDGTDLAARLRAHGTRRVFICGLATDYCVKATAIEAVENGFEAVVLTDAVAAVKRQPGDEQNAFDAMASRGVVLAETSDLEFALKSA